MNKKLLALYGLKWSPFSADVPVEALQITPRPAIRSSVSTTSAGKPPG